MRARKRPTITVGVGAAAVAVLGAGIIAAPAHAEPQGYTEVEYGVGFFYGSFDEDPNYVLLVGGSAEEFCDVGGDDPFGTAEPGTATARIFERKNGVVDIKVNSRNQPIYLYESDLGGPGFIEEFCDIYFDEDPATTVADPVATGKAKLKVRTSVISESSADVFNSVNGTLEAGDGTTYTVRAAADVLIRDDVPVGNPADFISFDLTEIRR